MHSPRLNWLLAQLPPADYERLLPHLELVGLDSGRQLFDVGQKDTGLYFPTTCTVSAQIELEDGNSTDIYLLGSRGFFGTGNNHRGSFFKAIVRQSGFAYRCPGPVYMQELSRSEGVMTMSLLATRIIMEEMATNISCRTFHNIGQQIARWLIAYSQGKMTGAIHITHAELADALGARRERVTLALNQAARKGGIRLSRGLITVRDGDLLRQMACNCHTEPVHEQAWSLQDLQDIARLPSLFKRPRT